MTNTNQPPAGGDVEARTQAKFAATNDARLPQNNAEMSALVDKIIDAYLSKLTSTKAEPSRIAEIQTLLLDEAKSHSDFTKSMQARRKAEYIERGETAPDYRGMEPEETIYWEAATIITAIEAERKRAEDAYFTTSGEVMDILGRVLGYPHYKDDQKNFPGATDADGICPGEHVAQSMAAEAAAKIKSLEADRDRMREALELARPLVEKWCHTQGNSQPLFATYLGPIDAALTPQTEEVKK